MSAPRLEPELVRKHLLDALARTNGHATTSQLRHLLLDLAPALVNEIIYRNLVVLEHRGQIRRLRLPGRRHVAWTITPAPTPPTGGHDR